MLRPGPSGHPPALEVPGEPVLDMRRSREISPRRRDVLHKEHGRHSTSGGSAKVRPKVRSDIRGPKDGKTDWGISQSTGRAAKKEAETA